MKKKGLILSLVTLAAGLSAGAVIFHISTGGSVQHPIRPEHTAPALDIVSEKIKADVPVPDTDALAGELPNQLDNMTLEKQTHEDPPEKEADHMQVKTLTQEEEEDIYVRAQVFRDEALAVFPVYSIEIHRPESMDTGWVEENGIMIEKSYGPPPDEIWIRIKPENSGEMRAIMAQMADLYQAYAGIYGRSVRIVNWVGGQAWAAFTYPAEGEGVQ
jgi:hypothetical protein